MSTPQPPSSGDRPDEADLSTPVEPTADATPDAEPAPAPELAAPAEPVVKKGPAPRKPPVRKTTAAKTTTPRKRATTKPAPPSPVGEAPGIMDATLGTSTPLAGTTETPGTTPGAEPVTAAVPGAVTGSTASTGPSSTESSSSVPAAVPEATAAPAADLSATTVITEEAPAASASAPADGLPQTEAPEAEAPETEAPETEAPQTEAPQTDARGADAPRRTVVDFADRLDDSRFFSALFDFTFTSYVTRRLAGPVYVVGLVLIALGILVGFSQSLAIAVSTQSPAGAFAFLLGVLVTLVAAVMAVLLLRVGIEVFVAIIEIAQNTRGRRRPPRD